MTDTQFAIIVELHHNKVFWFIALVLLEMHTTHTINNLKNTRAHIGCIVNSKISTILLANLQEFISFVSHLNSFICTPARVHITRKIYFIVIRQQFISFYKQTTFSLD